MNLRSRLRHIRETCGSSQVQPIPQVRATESAAVLPKGWIAIGDKTLRRSFILPFASPFGEKLFNVLPETLPLLIPDLAAVPMPIKAERFLFFDLETTGLSGGAGTVAFLAAFGRFVLPGGGNPAGIEITQILLLDYPGEMEFLEAVLAILKKDDLFLTTYNGKSFDSQILKTRCLMNGFAVPSLHQVDLLHPARRLWKRILPNCSQATIETMVLGLDRTGDLPGSMAPDIWVNFLRDGAVFSAGASSEALLGICDHNVKDISGLAALFRCFAEIAAAPLDAVRRFRCDTENLALRWRRGRLQPDLWDEPFTGSKTAAHLLEAAANNYPRSCLRLAFDLRARGRHTEAAAKLKALRNWPLIAVEEKGPQSTERGRECSASIKALALRALSIDAERRLGRQDLALSYMEEALALAGTPEAQAIPRGLREDLEKRWERLENPAT
jgi:uncharacterized protein YprB with RNaseH-like and TPR domain